MKLYREIKREQMARDAAEADAELLPKQPIGEENTAIPTVRLAITQEDAQSDEYISVMFADKYGETVGDPFDAELIFSDNATAGDECFPRIKRDKPVLLYKINGVWRIIYPSVGLMPDCV